MASASIPQSRRAQRVVGVAGPEQRAQEMAMEAIATLDAAEQRAIANVIDIRARRANIKAALAEMSGVRKAA